MISREELFHFSCKSCAKWWSIAGPVRTGSWWCPWCGDYAEHEECEAGLRCPASDSYLGQSRGVSVLSAEQAAEQGEKNDVAKLQAKIRAAIDETARANEAKASAPTCPLCATAMVEIYVGIANTQWRCTRCFPCWDERGDGQRGSEGG